MAPRFLGATRGIEMEITYTLRMATAGLCLAALFTAASAQDNPRARVRVCTASACLTYVLYMKVTLAANNQLVASVRKYFRTVAECLDGRDDTVKLLTGQGQYRYQEPDGVCAGGEYVTEQQWDHIVSEQREHGQYWPPGSRAPF